MAKKSSQKTKVYRFYKSRPTQHVFIAANNKKEALFLLLSETGYKIIDAHLFIFAECIQRLRYFGKPKIIMVTS